MAEGSIQMVEEESDLETGPVQSEGVLTFSVVDAFSNSEGGTLLGEGGVPGPHSVRLASISCTHGVPSRLVG